MITLAEADLIGVTRLEGLPLAEAARKLGIAYQAAKLRRWRAETRLVTAIRDGRLSDI